MGLSGGSKTTTSNQTGTTTPNVPMWGDRAVGNYYDQLYRFGVDTQFGGMGKQFVAPSNDLQKQAYGAAQNLGGYKGLFDNSSNVASGIANGSVVDNLSKYMNPYQGQVIDAALAGFDDQAGRDQAAYAAAGARNKAFGGSRFGVGEAQLTSDLARERAGTHAGLLDEGFKTASNLALSDRNMQLQGAGLLSSNANAVAGNARDDIASQIAAGNNLYAIDQAEAAAPLEWMRTFGSLINPNGVLDTFTGQTINSSGKATEKTSGGLLGGLGGLLSLAPGVGNLISALK